MIHTIYDTLLQPEKYIHFLDAKLKTLKNGWFELQKEFTATQSKKVLIIGNFSIRSNRQIVDERRLSSKNVYIAVDDISITSSGKDNCSGYEKLKDSLYSIKERHSNSKYINSVVNIQVSTRQRVDTLIINNIEFDFKSYKIKNIHNLQTLNERLMDSGITKIQIFGFTDTIGTKAYNKDLSLRRAHAVANYIRQTFNFIQPIELEGRGVSSLYKNPEQNRRVEIYIFR